jgi:hypothetical protein
MRIRYKIAIIAFSLSCITIGVWRGSAVQSTSVNPADCNADDLLSRCAARPELGIPSGDLPVVAGPELASAGVSDDNLAIIRFTSTAEAAAITEFLMVNNASLIDGPRIGGLYTIQLRYTDKAKVDHIKRMQAQSAIVDFIAAVQ